MKKINNVLLVGVGAIGSIYALKIHEYDKNMLSVLVDEKRLEKYINEGIFFNSKRCNFPYVLPIDDLEPIDLIIIATKSDGFSSAMTMIEKFVSEKTIIMSLLNGISSEEELIKKFGKEKVLYSFYVGHASQKRLNRISYDGIGTIVFGEETNEEYSENVQKVKRFFDEVGIDYEIPQDMKSALWQKFIMNIGINQASAIFNADYKRLQEDFEVREFATALMKEAVKVAKGLGINGHEDAIANTFDLIDSMPRSLKPSMLQDLEAGKKTEVESFALYLCELAKELGIETPANQKAYDTITTLEKSTVCCK